MHFQNSHQESNGNSLLRNDGWRILGNVQKLTKGRSKELYARYSTMMNKAYAYFRSNVQYLVF